MPVPLQSAERAGEARKILVNYFMIGRGIAARRTVAPAVAPFNESLISWSHPDFMANPLTSLIRAWADWPHFLRRAGEV